MTRNPAVTADLSGRVVLVTGANSGMGKECAREAARMGGRVVLGCRDEHRGQAAASRGSSTPPPAKVFRAHTDPDLLVQWLGPRDLEMRVDTFDCRTGGSYRYVHTRGEDEFGFHGCFHEVRPSELIIQTFTFEGAPDGVALERLTLEELRGGRSRLVVSSLVESFEARDAILASGMEHGVREGYEKLDEFLAK